MNEDKRQRINSYAHVYTFYGGVQKSVIGQYSFLEIDQVIQPHDIAEQELGLTLLHLRILHMSQC